MGIFNTLLLVLQIGSALGVIALVLLQQGKGADMGAAFGSGNSGSLFGAAGSANFLSRTTAVLATVFFVATLGLTMAGSQRPTSGAGVMGNMTTSQPAGVPASVPASGAPAADTGSSAPVAPAVPK
jgi:preprotein translocase subunit SecG